MVFYEFLLGYKDISRLTIISGSAKGADELAVRYAKFKGISYKEYPAEWKRYGKKAGFIRNKQLVDIADHVIAFWDGNSKGTKHTIDLADSEGINTTIIYI